jgi:hypothetical protein
MKSIKVKRLAVVIALMLTAISATAQTGHIVNPPVVALLSTAIKPVHVKSPRVDWALLAADVSVRGLDVYSTHKMLALGDHELFLPDVISHHTGTMAAYSGAVVVLDYFGMKRIERRHPKMAHVLMSVEIGQDGFWATKNLTLAPATPVIKVPKIGRL